MGFLSNLIDSAWDGVTGAGSSVGRQLNDLAMGDLSGANGETENTFNSLSEIPATDFANLAALYDGANGDLSWNPYSQDNSVWDRGAGGSASYDPNNRRWGRTIGTLAGGYYTAGAFGGGAGGGAASGALWGGGQAAGTGGNVWEGAARGALGGGAGGYIAGLDAAGNAGVENELAKTAINRGISSGLTTALTPGSSGKDIGKSTVYGVGMGGLGGMFSSNNDANPYAMDYQEGGGLQSTNQSKAPWANPSWMPESSNAYESQSSAAPWAPQGYQGDRSSTPSDNPFKTQLMGYLSKAGLTPNNFGSIAEGLAGIYQANRQRKQAAELMNMMGGRRGAYESQLRNNLSRRDAASGRRSDYAGRETQLQAALAELDSRNAPALMNLSNMKLGGQMGMLQSGLRLGNKLDWFNPGPQMSNGIPSMAMAGAPISLADLYQPQQQIDPMNWERQRRYNQFGA